MKNYANLPVSVPCPVCATESAVQLWQVSSRDAAQHYVLKEAAKERYNALVKSIESLWGGENCRVVRCGSCQFVFSDPYIAGNAGFYGLAYERSGYPKWKWEYQITLEALRHEKKSEAYLEIGAGDGAFVSKVVNELIPPERAFCTEFSEYGRNRIRELGIRCEAKDIRDIKAPEFQGHFDVVCMFQVLEHLADLDSLFKQLRWLTTKSAHMYIAVPNPDRIEYNELNGALWDMPPNHIGRYRKATFEAICARWGWEMLDHKIERSPIFDTAKSFVLYRFLKRAQDSSSWENKVMRISHAKLRKAVQLVGVAIHLLLSMPALARMASKHRGMSQWVHLRKQDC